MDAQRKAGAARVLGVSPTDHSGERMSAWVRDMLTFMDDGTIAIAGIVFVSFTAIAAIVTLGLSLVWRFSRPLRARVIFTSKRFFSDLFRHVSRHLLALTFFLFILWLFVRSSYTSGALLLLILPVAGLLILYTFVKKYPLQLTVPSYQVKSTHIESSKTFRVLLFTAWTFFIAFIYGVLSFTVLQANYYTCRALPNDAPLYDVIRCGTRLHEDAYALSMSLFGLLFALSLIGLTYIRASRVGRIIIGTSTFFFLMLVAAIVTKKIDDDHFVWAIVPACVMGVVAVTNLYGRYRVAIQGSLLGLGILFVVFGLSILHGVSSVSGRSGSLTVAERLYCLLTNQLYSVYSMLFTIAGAVLILRAYPNNPPCA